MGGMRAGTFVAEMQLDEVQVPKKRKKEKKVEKRNSENARVCWDADENARARSENGAYLGHVRVLDHGLALRHGD